jgi:DNA polymerase III delta prime subunit
MHAYLLIGTNSKNIEKEIEKIGKRTKSEVVRFPFQKIADSRDLSNFLKLKRKKKRVIVLENVDSASLETSNSFLKNLEEPQSGVTFVLTAQNSNNILPTIISRCEVSYVGSREPTKNEVDKSREFLKMETTKRLRFIESYKGRNSAIEFLEGLIFTLHKYLDKKPKHFAKVLDEANKTLSKIKQNANSHLQLTNFVIRVDKNK